MAVMTPVVVTVAGGMALFVRLTVRAAIDESNEKQLAKINGTYTRSAGAQITGAEIQRNQAASTQDLAEVRADVKDILAYTHTSVHELRNKLQVVQMLTDLLVAKPKHPPV